MSGTRQLKKYLESDTNFHLHEGLSIHLGFNFVRIKTKVFKGVHSIRMSQPNNDINPWEVHPLDADLNKQLLEHFKGERSGFLQFGPSSYFLPQKFSNDADNYYNFKPRPSDTWVVSFPRSGTTWTQEMVWLLANDLDYSKAAQVPLVERFPFLEFSSCVNDEVLHEFMTNAKSEEIREDLKKACGPILEELDKTTGNRFIKTHLPFSLLPPDLLTCEAKVVYVARNPKDVAVSYYNFHQFIKTLDFVGDFETFWNYFERNLELWTPYWNHVIEGWSMRNNPNLLFLFYEELKEDLKGNIKKVADFLGKKYNEEEMDKLTVHLDFENFKKNQSVNMEILRKLGMLTNNNQRCIRQGKPGAWRELFSEKLNDQADKWIKQNLEHTDLKFPKCF